MPRLIGPWIVFAILLTALVSCGGDNGSSGNANTYVEGIGIQQDLMPSRMHVGVGFSGQDVVYSTSPPTSGDHWDTPVRCGFYDRVVPDETIVHNLEHSNIVVSYNLDSPDEVDQLRNAIEDIGLAKVWGVTRFYPEIPPGTVAVAAWGVLDTVQEVDGDRIKRFFDAYSGTLGPEVIDCVNSARMP